MITDQKELTQQRALLRAPFGKNLISKLPKETKAQKDARIANNNVAIRCNECDGWHHKDAIHLDYIGHAAITDRLLVADPEWSWAPMACTPEGLPRFDETGGLWIKLTVLGVTRLGYGHAMAKPFGEPGNREKEVIGDALRNAAMRFGLGLDLWHKGGPMHDDEPSASPGAAAQEPAAAPKKKGAPKVAPAADRPATAQPEAKAVDLVAVLKAFEAAPNEAALLEAGKLAGMLPAKDQATARKAYGIRRSELQLRQTLLGKIRPVLKNEQKLATLVEFCGSELGVLLAKPADLDGFPTEALESISKWLGTAPEVAL